MVDVRWASYGGWSGPWIKGARTYIPARPPASWEDVLVYAVAYPEGGAWDSFFAADGTAVTAGIFQHTLTSGRLQKLLEVCRLKAPVTFAATVGKLFADWGLTLKDGIIYRGSTKLVSRATLQVQFTPPNGKTPETGPNWEKAKMSALAFNALFRDPALDVVQQNFFLDELQREAALRRPKLNNRTINALLYPADWPTTNTIAVFPNDAARAMFFSFWQNSPRVAETYLYAVNSEVPFKKDVLSFTMRLARKFAHSTFGNWGIEKAATNEREARYTKIVNCINRQMVCKLPQNP